MTAMGLVSTPLSERMTGFTDGPLTEEQVKERIGPGETTRNVLWADLSAEEKAYQAKKMEVHAAMIDRMDREIGHLVDWLKDAGRLDNTLILFASDNGASSEQLIRGNGHDRNARIGSAESFLCLGPGWACTANAPFRYSKKYVYEGGIASPLVVHWPAGIRDRGSIRSEPAHIVDLFPTLNAAAGGVPSDLAFQDAPPLPGANLLPAFSGAGVSREDGLFFAHLATRSIRKDGWKAVRYGNGPWELYSMEDDRAETRNLAAEHPEKLDELIREWEARNAEFLTDSKS
jgi:arylsulfatase